MKIAFKLFVLGLCFAILVCSFASCEARPSFDKENRTATYKGYIYDGTIIHHTNIINQWFPYPDKSSLKQIGVTSLTYFPQIGKPIYVSGERIPYFVFVDLQPDDAQFSTWFTNVYLREDIPLTSVFETTFGEIEIVYRNDDVNSPPEPTNLKNVQFSDFIETDPTPIEPFGDKYADFFLWCWHPEIPYLRVTFRAVEIEGTYYIITERYEGQEYFRINEETLSILGFEKIGDVE